MRKINILKAIVDLLWIFSMPVVLLIIGFSVAIFFIDLGALNIEMNSVTTMCCQKCYFLSLQSIIY